MEYYIFCTYNCNLSCSYCSANRVVINNNKETLCLNDHQIDKISDFINRDISIRNKNDNSIVFFGGEPCLVPEVIERIIDATSHLELEYIMYTNGVLLDEFPKYFINSISTIIVSIDGDKQMHEKHRGRGTYDRIIQNIKSLQSLYNGNLLARITLEEGVNIYKAVTSLLDHFDSIYWQIVNKPRFMHADSFLYNYERNIRSLFEFWFYNFERGLNLCIIPFQAILNSIIFEDKYCNMSFRCGSGTALQVIDTDGNVYECDEYVGNIEKSIGNTNNGNYPILRDIKNTELFDDCKLCEVSDLCRGRCRKCLSEYDKKQIQNYCNSTKSLIRIIKDYEDKVRNIIKLKKISSLQFYKGPYCTEEMP